MHRLLQKLHNANQIKLGVVLSYASTIITAISGLLYTPYMLRCIGQSDYGLFSLVTTFLGYFLLDFGLGNAVVRYVSRYRAKGDKQGEENFLAVCFILYCIIDFLILIAIFVCYFFIEQIFGKSLTPSELEKFKVMYVISGGASILSFPFNSIVGAISGYEKFVFPKMMQIANQLLRLIVMIVLLAMGYKVIAMVLCNAIIGLLIMMIQLYYGFAILKIRPKLYSFDTKLVSGLIRYSFFVFLGMIVDMLYWRIGPTILGIVSGANDVAIFSIGMIFVNLYLSLSTAISTVFVPRVTKMIVNNASPQTLTDLMIRIGRVQFIVIGILLSGMVALGKQFITIWAGSQYLAAYYVACILIIPLTIPLTQNIGISILFAQNRHAFRSVMLLIIAMINVIISYFFIKEYGAVGASFGTALSLILGQGVVLNIYYHRCIGLDIPRFFMKCIFPLLTPMFITILVGYLLNFLIPMNTLITLVCKVVIFIPCYIAVMWLTTMNDYEKKLLGTPIMRLLGRSM